MKILRLKIYQPSAHYKIPFTFARRHTYPIPPFSTVIGFLCNVLGIKEPIEKPEEYKISELNNISFKDFANGLFLAIYGKFESITREYVWFRNLEVDSHKSRFTSSTNRIIDQTPEHPGGQMPTRIDVLENVYLVIYIAHKNEKIIEELKEIIKNPEERTYPLHLGRAEDWIVFDGEPEESIKIVETIEKSKLLGKSEYYTWLPDYRKRNGMEEFEYVGLLDEIQKENYKKFFDKIQGSSHLITSFYQIKNGIRVFEHIPVKLFEGGSFPMYFGKPFEFSIDKDTEIPLIFTKMKYPEV